MSKLPSVPVQTYYRWRNQYSGTKTEQVRSLKELERENVRLKKAVAELTLDKLVLKEAAEGNVKTLPVADDALTRSSASMVSRNVMPAVPGLALAELK